MFFSDELARLFKLPSVTPVLSLCGALVTAFEKIDDSENPDDIMASIPDFAVDSFD